MLSKKTTLASAIALGLIMPALASASDLTIVNNTNLDSTSIINDGFCSTKVLGNDGITRAKTTKVIKEYQIKLACMRNLENCKADVYMTNNCTGDIITTVYFSVKTGIKKVSTPKQGYVVTYTPFSFRLDQAK